MRIFLKNKMTSWDPVTDEVVEQIYTTQLSSFSLVSHISLILVCLYIAHQAIWVSQPWVSGALPHWISFNACRNF